MLYIHTHTGIILKTCEINFCSYCQALCSGIFSQTYRGEGEINYGLSCWANVTHWCHPLLHYRVSVAFSWGTLDTCSERWYGSRRGMSVQYGRYNNQCDYEDSIFVYSVCLYLTDILALPPSVTESERNVELYESERNEERYKLIGAEQKSS